MSSITKIAVLCLAMAVMLAASADWSRKERRRVEALEERLEELENNTTQLDKSMRNLGNEIRQVQNIIDSDTLVSVLERLDLIQNEAAELRELTEQTGYSQERMQSRMREIIIDFDRRIGELRELLEKIEKGGPIGVVGEDQISQAGIAQASAGPGADRDEANASTPDSEGEGSAIEAEEAEKRRRKESLSEEIGSLAAVALLPGSGTEEVPREPPAEEAKAPEADDADAAGEQAGEANVNAGVTVEASAPEDASADDEPGKVADKEEAQVSDPAKEPPPQQKPAAESTPEQLQRAATTKQVKTLPPKPKPNPKPDKQTRASREYAQALRLFSKREYKNALKVFTQIYQQHPEYEQLAGDATYWAADCHYNIGQLHDALALFRRFESKYSGHRKQDDNMLKMGYVLHSLGEFDESERVLSSLLSSKREDIARLASARLRRVKLDIQLRRR